MKYFSKHTLVGDDSKGEVVDRKGVVLTVDDFRSHIAWSSRCILIVIRGVNASDS